MKQARLLLPLVVLTAAGCTVTPYRWSDNGERMQVQPIDGTRITVRQEFRYVPSFTAYVLPAGDYLPIRSDAGGTYYESPRGILVLAATGGFVVHGGIYRRSAKGAHYPFVLYLHMPGGGEEYVDLHSLWGLNLNEKITCDPPYVFP